MRLQWVSEFFPFFSICEILSMPPSPTREASTIPPPPPPWPNPYPRPSIAGPTPLFLFYLQALYLTKLSQLIYSLGLLSLIFLFLISQNLNEKKGREEEKLIFPPWPHAPPSPQPFSLSLSSLHFAKPSPHPPVF